MKVNIQYPEVKCAYCGKPFKKQHNRQKYCSKTCSQNAHREQKNKWAYHNYHTNKNKINNTRIGTRTIGPHKHPITTREQEIVTNEKQRLLNNNSNCLDYNMKVW